MGDRRRTSYIIRALAGVYVAYLGYTLLRGLFTGEADYNIIFAVCGVAFILTGIGLVISCLRYMKSEAASQQEELREEDAMQEEPPAIEGDEHDRSLDTAETGTTDADTDTEEAGTQEDHKPEE